ncbi:13663_t:CDS:2, partial [Gigaspora margarita]
SNMNDKGKRKATSELEIQIRNQKKSQNIANQKHQRAKQQLSTLVLNQLNDNDIKIMRQIKCVYFAAKKHLSFNVYPDLYKSEKSKKYKSYGSYLNPIVAQNFAKAIVHIIERELITSVIAAQYIAFNVPVICYMGVIKLDNCRSEYIFEKLKNFIASKGLNIENIMHF